MNNINITDINNNFNIPDSNNDTNIPDNTISLKIVLRSLNVV